MNTVTPAMNQVRFLFSRTACAASLPGGVDCVRQERVSSQSATMATRATDRNPIASPRANACEVGSMEATIMPGIVRVIETPWGHDRTHTATDPAAPPAARYPDCPDCPTRRPCTPPGIPRPHPPFPGIVET